MVEAQTVRGWLSLGTETRSFEVKGAGSRKTDAYVATVARAVMAMGNLRDGGTVCLGIDDTMMAAMSPGLSPVELDEWSDADEVNVALARFIDPPADVRVHPLELCPGVNVVVLEVREFFDLPHLCKRSCGDKLHEGQLYVRPRGKPQSMRVSSVTEMREVVDLATEKGVREFLRRAQGAGLALPGVQSGVNVLTSAGDTAYAKEYEQAWSSLSSELAQMQRSLGYFDVAIRPHPYRAGRFNAGQLAELVSDLTVRLRGWPLPFTDHRETNPIARHGQWIAQDYLREGASHREAWRMCSSGQFLHRKVLTSDERPDYELAQASVPGARGTVVVWDVLLYLVEVAEFAARLASASGCDGVDIEVRMHNLQGRQLVSGDFKRDVDVHGLLSTDTLHGQATAARPELLTEPRRVGVRLAQTVLRQFGLNLPDGFLMDWQAEVLSS